MIMLAAAGSAHAQAQPPPQDQAQARANPTAAAAPGAPEGSPVTPTLPTPIDQLTLNDDLLGAAVPRDIGDRRVEALVATGTEATHLADARASDTLHGVGLEL